MCGIVGAVSQRDVTSILTEGIRRLEYRGYDSCGIAVLQDGAPRRVRSVARVTNLEAQISVEGLSGTLGIAHTRWATHGAPVTDNAHPIFSRGEIALVHNGIIENSAIAVFGKSEPDRVIGARAGSPLVVGFGAEGN